MAKNPAFQFYASDFLTDTNAWDAVEVGIYIRLLSTQWVNGFLPNDLKRLARISGVDDAIFEKAWVFVGLKLGLCEDGHLRNAKLEVTRQQRDAFRSRQAENGKKGGRPANKTPNETQTEPRNNPGLSSGLTQTITQKNPLEVEDEIEEEVENEKRRKEAVENFSIPPADEIYIPPDKDSFLIPQMETIWLKQFPRYPKDESKDYTALADIIDFFATQEKIKTNPFQDESAGKKIKEVWQIMCGYVAKDNFYKNFSLRSIANNSQSISIKIQNESDPNKSTKGFDPDKAKSLLDSFSD